MPLAPGEQREAAPPGWRLREGLVARSLIDSNDGPSRSVGSSPHFPPRIDDLRFWEPSARNLSESTARSDDGPGPGFLWVDHGESGSWLRVERDEANDWVLTVETPDVAYDVIAATPWGSLWNGVDRARDWAPGESEDFAPRVIGPAGCRWDRVAFALDERGMLPGGTPIVMYALSTDQIAPFKLVTTGVYDDRFDRERTLTLLAEADVFMAATDGTSGDWVETACPVGERPKPTARALELERETGRVYFSTERGIGVLEEGQPDAAASREFDSWLAVRLGHGAPGPMVTDGEGTLLFASGAEVFELGLSGGARPDRIATAPRGSTIAGMAWSADRSALFLGVRYGTESAGVVALSAR